MRCYCVNQMGQQTWRVLNSQIIISGRLEGEETTFGNKVAKAGVGEGGDGERNRPGQQVHPGEPQQSVVTVAESSWMRQALQALHKMCPSSG